MTRLDLAILALRARRRETARGRGLVAVLVALAVAIWLALGLGGCSMPRECRAGGVAESGWVALGRLAAGSVCSVTHE